MPLDYTSRNIVAGATSPYIPLITNNPAFQVKIVALDGKLEQKPGAKSDREQQEAVKVGDTVRGEIVSRTKKRGSNVIARILQIELDDNEVVAYKAITQHGKEVTLDPTTVVKIQVNGQKQLSSPNINSTFENRILLYEEWKYTQKARGDI